MIKPGDILICTHNKEGSSKIELFKPLHVKLTTNDDHFFEFEEFENVAYTSNYHIFIKLSEYRKLKLNELNEISNKEIY